MTGMVTSLWRHPIKSHGRESLDAVTLIAGQTMPGDRVWAVAHEMSKADNSAWARCASFSIGSKAPKLTAINAQLDDANNLVTLSHPDKEDLTFDPDGDATAFLDWVRPLMPDNRAASTRIVRVPGRGMTDSDFPSITLCSMASHRAVEEQIGHDLSINRWRGNIWFDGLPVWQEFDWIGKEVQIGDVILRGRERTDRCLATTANPETGVRDADTLDALDHWGHRDFSIRAEVIRGGNIHIGDTVTPL
jgi:MOSC domain-containing protein